MGPKSNDWCPYKKRKHRERGRPYGDGGRDWSDATTSHEVLLDTGRGKEGSSPQASEGAGPCLHVDSGLAASRTFLLF